MTGINIINSIINDTENLPERVTKVNKLKNKIDKIIRDDCWDLDGILLEHNYTDSTVFECVVYILGTFLLSLLPLAATTETTQFC